MISPPASVSLSGLTLLAFAATNVGAGVAHAGVRKSCAVQTRAMTLVAVQPTSGSRSQRPSPATRVVARSRRRNTESTSVIETVYFGCTEPARRVVRLGTARTDNLRDPATEDVLEWISDLRIAGRYVAFVHGTLDQGVDDPVGGGPFEMVGVVDLVRARHLTPTRFCGRVSGLYCGEVTGLQLNARGAAAWAVSGLTSDGATARDRAVWSRTRSGLRQLDRGPDVDAGSVALGPTYVGWIRGGTQHFAIIG